jgi:hypothetical protein
MPSEKVLPARMNMELITKLQNDEATIFTPKAVYDGRKNLFAIRELPFGPEGTKQVSFICLSAPSSVDTNLLSQFDVILGNPATDGKGKGPKVYKIRLTKVAEINPVYVIHISSMNDPCTEVKSQCPAAVYLGATVARQQCSDGHHCMFSVLIFPTITKSLLRP